MKTKIILLLTLLSLFTISCASSDETPVDYTIVDDYKILAVSSGGNIFEIGNNSGNVTITGHIENKSGLLQLPTFCKVGSKFYAFEASYIPFPNNLHIYDQLTGITVTQHIIFPLSVSTGMTDPVISNVNYNGTELIAIVVDNMSRSIPSKVIAINLENYQTTDLEISFAPQKLTSTVLINNQLYVSTLKDGLLKIDLEQKNVIELLDNESKINGTRISQIGTSKLCIMKFGFSQYINGVRPYEYNLQSKLLTNKSGEDIFAVGNITGGSTAHNGEYLNLVFTVESNFGLLKINYETNEQKFVEIYRDKLDTNTIILGIVD